jgi:pimeloyl-ACP methyl ester carboxylesterase
MARMLQHTFGALSCAVALAACASAPPPAAGQSDHYFESRDARLHARLYTPAGRGPYRTVLYVHGAGNYSLLEDPYAQNTVRAFVERGMAVLVFNKRGVGESGGDYEGSNLAGKTEDVRAALDYLRTRSEVDHSCVVVWAISQAGHFAPQAIEGRRDVCGFILVSPIGERPIDYYTWDTRRELTRAGLSGADADEAVALWRALLRYQGDGENYESVRALMAAADTRPWRATTRGLEMWEDMPETAAALPTPDALRQAWAAQPGDYAWQREAENYQDFAPVYARIRQPVLLIYGGADSLIDPVASRRVFEAAIGARADVTITTYDGAGDGIQRPRDPEHPMPAYLDQITTWGAGAVRWNSAPSEGAAAVNCAVRR